MLDLSFTTTNLKPPTWLFLITLSPSTELHDKTNILYMFKCLVGDCVSKENNAYIGFTTTTLSRQLTMNLNDSSPIALHLKTHSIPKSKFRKILEENTTIMAHEIDKLRLQIPEALHIKTNKPKINRIHFENSDNVLKCFYIFFSNILYFLIVFYFRW